MHSSKYYANAETNVIPRIALYIYMLIETLPIFCFEKQWNKL